MRLQFEIILQDISKEDSKMNRNSENSGSNRGYIVLWDRVFIAAGIFLIIIIGVISLIVFLASGDSESNNKNVEKQIIGSSFKNNSSEPEVEEDVDRTLNCTVVIDAGHGGEDGGCTDYYETRLEKDDNLAMALEVADRLEELGIDVILTRNDDTFIGLQERCDIANEANADLFISLHRNSAFDGSGVEIWVSNKEPAEDTLLAQNIMDAFAEVGVSNNRGVCYGYIGDQYSNYYVNSVTEMPSCLVEMGFITEEIDNELFDKNFYEYADAIAQAIYKSAEELNVLY